MEWRDRKVAVIGLGVSNIPLIRYLVGEGARITVCDRQKPVELESRLAQIAGLPVSYKLGEGYLDDLADFDAVLLSPGVPKDLPQLRSLRERGIRFSSEMEVFFELCPAPIVGITGSSGKTTTTTLVGEILKAQGTRRVFVGGNIGNSLLEDVPGMSPDDLVVLELSSFQLESLPYSPNYALVTNITPNHLDVHKTMEAYIEAKRRILTFQQPGDCAVLNYDNDITRLLASQCPGRVYYFSRLTEPQRGAFLRGGEIILRDVGFAEGREEILCPISAVRLLGVHNWENVLAAVTMAALCGAQPEAMVKVIATFTGVPHRLELVAEINGVKYYNDSIATSPARAIAGINALREPLVLIAGGYDKQLSFDQLAETIVERVKAVVLVGATADKLEKAIRSKQRQPDQPVICRSEDFDQAVLTAAKLAVPGDVVLLSPACASYDMFRNFEERGERFRKIVRELVKES
ncbi:MAG TPA: UDP-N-acetylmuramoyl-L-alanine--D-glutamate ligase [Firmicutes bacterium]|nr:UDP-N-acetylmuramoyl-L-alanine--D-glutamate ligase [Bacillota bacterium]